MFSSQTPVSPIPRTVFGHVLKDMLTEWMNEWLNFTASLDGSFILTALTEKTFSGILDHQKKS